MQPARSARSARSGCPKLTERLAPCADRKLLLKYHPDKKVGEEDTAESDAKFLHVQKAFDVLSDPEQRKGCVGLRLCVCVWEQGVVYDDAARV